MVSEPTEIALPEGQGREESGFSLIEALVVLAVSSVLLVVLTNTMSQSRAQNAQLAEHFRLTGDAFYADLQLQALLSGLYIDPLLQPSGARPSRIEQRLNFHTEGSWTTSESDVAFRGTSEAFEFSTQFQADGAKPVPAKVRWIDTMEGRKLSLTLGEDEAVWPVLYDPQTRFRYMSSEGELLENFPPAPVRARFGQAPSRTDQPSPIAVPKAIMAYRDDIQKVVFIVDVP